MTGRFLAVDIGAASGRAIVGAVSDRGIGLQEISRFPNGPMSVNDTLRWNFDALATAVTDSVNTALAGSERLDGIGIDTWGVDYGLLDDDSVLVEPPYHYRDHRTDGMVARVVDRIGRDRLYETTGIQCLAINTLYQLRAAVERTPAVFERARRLLTIPDLINQRLTGRAVCEFTNATTTQCINARTRTWALDIIADLEIPTRLFGPIVEPGTVLGGLSPHVTAMANRAAVVAPACHDTGSAVAAIRTGGDTAFLSSGTWSLLGTEVPAPVLSARARELNFTNEGGVAGTFRLLKNITGLWLLQACRHQWEEQGQRWSYEDLVSAADAASPFRTLIDVDDESFLNPASMPDAIAAFARRSEQPEPASPAAFTRCIFESLAMKYRQVTDALEELTGGRIRTIRLVGGGANNTLLTQFTADATGRTVLAGPVEATALGNIAMQMVATGHATSIGDAREIIQCSFPPERYEPQRTDQWDTHLTRLRRR